MVWHAGFVLMLKMQVCENDVILHLNEQQSCANHIWKVSHEGLKPLHGVVDQLKQKFDKFQIAHIYRQDIF